MGAISKEIISLTQYVELRESKWWENAIDRLILGGIYLSENNVSSIEKIVDFLENDCKLIIDKKRVELVISRLISSSDVFEISTGIYKLSDIKIKDYSKEIVDYSESENYAKDYFVNELIVLDIEKNHATEIWNKFSNGFLSSYIYELGAKTYEIIINKNIEDKSKKIIDNFLKEFTDEKEKIKSVMIKFIISNQIQIKNYILKRLAACFMIEASSLDKNTIEKISEIENKNYNMSIFLDTNFILSLLELHDNPANEEAINMLHLAKVVSDKLHIKFYVLPITIDEIKNVLISNLTMLNDFQLTNPSIRKVMKERVSISGIVKKYLSYIEETYVSTEDYFDPYIRGLKGILKDKGIEIFNERLDHYFTDDFVVDEINSQLEFETRAERVSKKRPKSYEQLQHDIVLWKFVDDKRNTYVENVFDPKFWVLTVDNSFLRYDNRLKRRDNKKVQNCLHPSALMQIFELWIPRDEQLIESVFINLKYPFLIIENDIEFEPTTYKVLSKISRYNNIGNLSEKTIAGILVDQVVRNKLEKSNITDEEVSLILDEKLIESLKEKEEELEQKEIEKEQELIDLSNRKEREKEQELSNLLKQKELEKEQELIDLSNRKEREKEQELSNLLKQKEIEKEQELSNLLKQKEIEKEQELSNLSKQKENEKKQENYSDLEKRKRKSEIISKKIIIFLKIITLIIILGLIWLYKTNINLTWEEFVKNKILWIAVITFLTNIVLEKWLDFGLILLWNRLEIFISQKIEDFMKLD